MKSDTRWSVLLITLLVALYVTGCTSDLTKEGRTISSYEVLEPANWIDKELPILDCIDIGRTLTKGTWLVLLYHYDCPDCSSVIPRYEQMARELEGNEDFLQIALIAVPPYDIGADIRNSPCKFGRLIQGKQWFVTTPVVVLLTDGIVASAWVEKVPDFQTVLKDIAQGTIESRVSIKIERR